MRTDWLIVCPIIVALFATGCQSRQVGGGAQDLAPAASTEVTRTLGQPAAYLNSEGVTREQLYRLMVQAQGGQALAEVLLDRAVRDRLKQEGIVLSDEQVEAERTMLLDALDPDPEQAARLLVQMRAERGLDQTRYTALLRRNAGLRRLDRDGVTVGPAAIEQAYAVRYGRRYRVRLIAAEAVDTLSAARRRALAGESFADLAIEFSTDTSANQGGLLSPISPADPTYPKSIRDALARLTMGDREARLSPVIALPEGYAMLWLEEIVERGAPPVAQVRGELEAAVRSEVERVRMRQLARVLIEQANVVVLDPALAQSWQQHLDTLMQR